MKLICAPMATLSHAAFRILIEKFGGCDEYFNEMINAPSLVNGGKFEDFYIEEKPVPQKLVRQLTGKTVDAFTAAARILCPLNGIGMDLNMGCSAPDIVKSGAGIAWMLKPVTETERMVQSVKKVLRNYEEQSGIHRRLSVKLRLGDSDFTDKDFFAFCDMLVQNGVEFITIHPRTKKEKFREAPRYHYAEELALRCKPYGVKVCVNGDINDVRSAENVMRLCPDCDSIMIGRAAVEKPWIFAEIRKRFAQSDEKIVGAESGSEKEIDLLELAVEFTENVKNYQPEEFWRTRLQRFFFYFCKNFWFENYVKNKLMNSKTPEESVKILEEYFERVGGDRFKRIVI